MGVWGFAGNREGGFKQKKNIGTLYNTITQPNKRTKEKIIVEVTLYMPDVYKARLYYYLLWITFTVY